MLKYFVRLTFQNTKHACLFCLNFLFIIRQIKEQIENQNISWFVGMCSRNFSKVERKRLNLEKFMTWQKNIFYMFIFIYVTSIRTLYCAQCFFYQQNWSCFTKLFLFTTCELDKKSCILQKFTTLILNVLDEKLWKVMSLNVIILNENVTILQNLRFYHKNVLFPSTELCDLCENVQ